MRGFVKILSLVLMAHHPFPSSMDLSCPCLKLWQKNRSIDSSLSHLRNVALLAPFLLLLQSSVWMILPPLVTRIINLSLSTGTVPGGLKEAVVAPLLKKAGLEIRMISKSSDQSQICHAFQRYSREYSPTSTVVPSFREQLTRNSTVCLQKKSKAPKLLF